MSIENTIIEIVSKMVYTVYSSKDKTFRSGLTFNTFKRNGKQKLKEFLDNKIHYG